MPASATSFWTRSTELDRLERIAAERHAHQEVLIRITPGVAGDTHHAISTGQADSKFGFAVDQAPEAISRLAQAPHLTLVGLHFHIGSQLYELEPFRAAVRAIAPLGDFPVYNLGGGLGAAYTADQQPPSIDEYVDTIVTAAHDELGPGKRLLFEPGRALVANSTVTLYTVESVKRNVSTWVAVDGGMSDNLRPMLYGARYESSVAQRPLARGTEPCNLAGKHCESGDVIAREVVLPDPVARRRDRDARHRRLRVLAREQLQRRAATTRDLLQRGHRPGGRAPRDLRRPGHP